MKLYQLVAYGQPRDPDETASVMVSKLVFARPEDITDSYWQTFENLALLRFVADSQFGVITQELELAPHVCGHEFTVEIDPGVKACEECGEIIGDF